MNCLFAYVFILFFFISFLPSYFTKHKEIHLSSLSKNVLSLYDEKRKRLHGVLLSLFVFFFLNLSLFDCFIDVCMYGYRSDDIKKVNLEHLKCHDTFFLMFSFCSFFHDGYSLLLSSLPLSHMQNVERVLANAFF